MPKRVSTLSIRSLRDAADAGLSGPSTPGERLALVDTLTREAWTLAGVDPPAYPRQEAPVSMRPLRVSERPARRES